MAMGIRVIVLVWGGERSDNLLVWSGIMRYA
jgi:hypothetical protein